MESAINLLAYARSSRKAFTMHKTQQSLEGVEAALKIIMNEGANRVRLMNICRDRDMDRNVHVSVHPR